MEQDPGRNQQSLQEAYVAGRHVEALLIRNALVNNGIPAEVTNLNSAYVFPAAYDFGCRILVPSEQLERAREVIAALRPRAEPDPATEAPAESPRDIWPRCPGCGKRRRSTCPACGHSEDLAVGWRHPEDAGTEFLAICPTCDEAFSPEFLPQCEWCDHRFDPEPGERAGESPEPEVGIPDISAWTLAALALFAGLALLIYLLRLLD